MKNRDVKVGLAPTRRYVFSVEDKLRSWEEEIRAHLRGKNP